MTHQGSIQDEQPLLAVADPGGSRRRQELSLRLRAQNPVRLKGVLLGGEAPVVCVPIVACDADEAAAIAQRAAASGADMLELRADYIEGISPACVPGLIDAVGKVTRIPLLFTNRLRTEGGACDLPEEERISCISAAIEHGGIAGVDIELATKPELRNRVIESAKTRGIASVVSHHDFSRTPSKTELIDIVEAEVEAGADIVKFAAMPRGPLDVLTLLEVTWMAKRLTGLPVISMSMGDIGRVSRVVGPMYGCDLTFASLGRASGPGQLSVNEIRHLLGMLTPMETHIQS